MDELAVDTLFDADIDGGADGLVLIVVPGLKIAIAPDISRQLREMLEQAEDEIMHARSLSAADADLLHRPPQGLA